MVFQPRTLLEGRFEIISLVMMGGQSVVYQATDRTTGRKVAVKVMRDIDGVSDVDARRQFLREYEVLSGGGPGLPAALASFEVNASPVVVEEWVEGHTLDQEGTHVPTERAVRLALGVLEALDHLHHRHPPVIVRDIKPSNVIVNGDRTYLIDLNSSRALRGARDTVTLGTPGFAAPEQYAGHSEERSDLFSVGAMLCWLLCGKDGDLASLPCSPASVRPDVSPELDDVVRRATAFDPNARWGSAAEMVAALRQAAQAPPGHGVRPKPVSAGAASAVVRPRPAARRTPAPPVPRTPASGSSRFSAGEVALLAATLFLSFATTVSFLLRDTFATVGAALGGAMVFAAIVLPFALWVVVLGFMAPAVRRLQLGWLDVVLGLGLLGVFGPLGAHGYQAGSILWPMGLWGAGALQLLRGVDAGKLLALLVATLVIAVIATGEYTRLLSSR